MTRYYTNVACVGNNIFFRGVKDGRRVKLKIGYSPTLFSPSKKPTQFKSLTGEHLEPMKFENIREARDFVKRYNEVSNLKIYGQTRYEYAFIADEHQGMVDWNMDDILVAICDIEVGSENGFPDPYKAEEPITAICISFLKGETVVFGCGDYIVQGSETYFKCSDETELCKKFLAYWVENCPDVLTGWNTKFFDIPYLVNRFRKILGEEETKKLSPWNMIGERKAVVNNRELIAYDMVGVSSLDYIELYRWYAPGGKSQESYKLDNIANVELGDSKLSFDEYDNLHALYRENFQKFIEYNIQDCNLIVRMEEKLKLIELGLTLAYDTKTNYEDIFAQTRMWDSMTYAYLLEKGIVVPPKIVQSKTSAFEGAYVKDPQVGMHHYIASFDLNSLYPHLMMQYSISPENIVDRNYVENRKKEVMQELRMRNTK